MITIPIPKKIQVAGFTYKIEQNGRAQHELQRVSNYGDNQEFSLTMRIDGNLSSQLRSHTFVHEILHIINDTYNNHNMTEEAIHSMGHGLSQVLEQLGVRFG